MGHGGARWQGRGGHRRLAGDRAGDRQQRGTALGGRTVAETTDEEYDRLMAVNTKAVFLALRYAARQTLLATGGLV
jgi:NAD(P)-dependent dehydrogenase (short-subunit alcohol dehydrogenase family)